MTPSLAAVIAGLAFLDSFNPATLGAVALILLAAPRRPGLMASAAVVGAALTVFVLGSLVFLSAGAATDAVEGIVLALRFVAFWAAAIILARAGFRRMRDRPRQPIGLPSWFGLTTAVPFGAMLTAADLPNAFPYFIAIERLVGADVGTPTGLATLGLYTVIYCLPCLLLLIAGLAARERTRQLLQRLVRKIGTGSIPRSVPLAIGLWLAAAVVATIPFILLSG